MAPPMEAIPMVSIPKEVIPEEDIPKPSCSKMLSIICRGPHHNRRFHPSSIQGVPTHQLYRMQHHATDAAAVPMKIRRTSQ